MLSYLVLKQADFIKMRYEINEKEFEPFLGTGYRVVS